MPYADPEKQRAYYAAREARRQADPEYQARRREQQRALYQDPERRARIRGYQRKYRARRRATDPEFRARERAQNLESSRRFKGLRWTPEQKAEFDSLTACEVCETTDKKLHADHCHACGAYRGGLCSPCNTSEGHLRKWDAVCPEGSPMRVYMDRHVCRD